MEVPNPKRKLKPGMFLRARIEFGRCEGATVVPVAALARREGHVGVFRADTEKMKAHFVPLKLGITEGELAQVVEPPLAGQVVTMGHHLLEDGAPIRLPAAEPSEAEGQKKPEGGDGRRPGGQR